MADWDPSDWEPGSEEREERWNADRQARQMGVDRDTVNAWLRANWLEFERKMNDYTKRRWAETGVNTSDGDKATHRRNFHALLRKQFGRSLPDKDWTDKVEQEITKRNARAA